MGSSGNGPAHLGLRTGVSELPSSPPGTRRLAGEGCMAGQYPQGGQPSAVLQLPRECVRSPSPAACPAPGTSGHRGKGTTQRVGLRPHPAGCSSSEAQPAQPAQLPPRSARSGTRGPRALQPGRCLPCTPRSLLLPVDSEGSAQEGSAVPSFPESSGSSPGSRFLSLEPAQTRARPARPHLTQPVGAAGAAPLL